MSIITSNSTEEKQLLNSMKIFFADFNVAKILRLDKFIGKLPKFYSSRLLGTTVG